MILAVFLSCGNAARTDISIDTRDPLSLTKGIYSSILFAAGPANTPEGKVPIQYQITPSGTPPPGMIFEVYPCNKPDTKVCPSIASSNGIFLDGVPTRPGSYEVTIAASEGTGRKASRLFKVTVNELAVLY